jgi:hypothetical protein
MGRTWRLEACGVVPLPERGEVRAAMADLYGPRGIRAAGPVVGASADALGVVAFQTVAYVIHDPHRL